MVGYFDDGHALHLQPVKAAVGFHWWRLGGRTEDQPERVH
jgi:hypothetical protein